MVKINNYFDNKNVNVVEEKGDIKIIEYIKDLSVTPETAMSGYYASKMNVRKRQAFIELKNNAYTISAGK